MNLKKPDRIGLEIPSKICSGCGHGIVSRLIAETADELNINEKLVMIHDVACGAMTKSNMRFDAIVTAHGRPIDTGSGYQKIRPENVTCVYIGDGACYSIGCAELVHAALRNDNISVIVTNNTLFGMTGGQMSPATMPGEKTMSSIHGKDPEKYGTLDVFKLLGNMDIAYLARGEVYNAPAIKKTKSLIKRAFQNQIEGQGFSIVEVLAPCPTNLHMTPVKAKEYIHTEGTKVFSLGVCVDSSKGGAE